MKGVTGAVFCLPDGLRQANAAKRHSVFLQLINLVTRQFFGFFSVFLAHLKKIFSCFQYKVFGRASESVRDRPKSETNPRVKLERQMGTRTLSIPLLKALVKKDIFVIFFPLLNVRDI